MARLQIRDAFVLYEILLRGDSGVEGDGGLEPAPYVRVLLLGLAVPGFGVLRLGKFHSQD